MDEVLAARYAQILEEFDPAFYDLDEARLRKLSTPFLVNGPRDATARKVMVIGREYGASGWNVKAHEKGARAYVQAALARHREVFDGFLAGSTGPGLSFPNFLRDLAKCLGTADGLIYSNLLCVDSRGKSPTRSKYFPKIADLSKRLLDVQIDHFRPDVIIFANGTSGEQVRIRRKFFPIKGKGRVFVSRRHWMDIGIEKGQLEEFELHGKFLCYRIQHPANWRGDAGVQAARARRHLLDLLSAGAPQAHAAVDIADSENACPANAG
ncbi:MULTISPECIES: hypothetical protein [Caballeronia]|nr:MULTISPECIES: hypothetical protein [Caballeronia]